MILYPKDVKPTFHRSDAEKLHGALRAALAGPKKKVVRFKLKKSVVSSLLKLPNPIPAADSLSDVFRYLVYTYTNAGATTKLRMRKGDAKSLRQALLAGVKTPDGNLDFKLDTGIAYYLEAVLEEFKEFFDSGETLASERWGDRVHGVLELHGCMGLNSCRGHGKNGTGELAGMGECATATHACAGMNDCRTQGMCGGGLPKEPPRTPRFSTTGVVNEPFRANLALTIQAQPGNNICAGRGGCDSPTSSKKKMSNPLGPYHGQSVWKVARQLFETRMQTVNIAYGPSPKPGGPK